MLARPSPSHKTALLSQNFENKTEYRLLTRVTGSYAKSAEFFAEICRTFSWINVGFLYQDPKTDTDRSDCYFITEAFYFAVGAFTNAEPWNKDFNQRLATSSDYEALLRAASLRTRGKGRNSR